MAKGGAIAKIRKQRDRAERWLRGSGARRRGAAAVTAVLVLAVVSAFLHEYWGAAFSTRPQLADETRRAVRDKADQLARVMEARLIDKGRLQGDAWTSAQILVALRENTAGYKPHASTRSIAQHFRSMAGPECTCWRRVPTGNFPK